MLTYKNTISGKFNTVRDMTIANNKPYTFMCNRRIQIF